MSEASLTIDVGGVVARILLPGGDVREEIRERYAAFLSGAAPAWSIGVHLDPQQPVEIPGSVRHEGAVTRFHIRDYRGEINLAARTAWVSAPSRERVAPAVERALTYILVQALPREHDALLLHACGVVLEGRGYVFFGPSGAGKTTVARLADGHAEVLCDENVVLRPAGPGFEVLSTPLWGWSTPPEMIRRTNRATALAGLYTLTHAPDFGLARLAPAQAVAALLATEKVATERVESAAAWLAVAARIVERIPVHTLSFLPTTELWSFLLRHEGG